MTIYHIIQEYMQRSTTSEQNLLITHSIKCHNQQEFLLNPLNFLDQ